MTTYEEIQESLVKNRIIKRVLEIVMLSPLNIKATEFLNEKYGRVKESILDRFYFPYSLKRTTLKPLPSKDGKFFILLPSHKTVRILSIDDLMLPHHERAQLLPEAPSEKDVEVFYVANVSDLTMCNVFINLLVYELCYLLSYQYKLGEHLQYITSTIDEVLKSKQGDEDLSKWTLFKDVEDLRYYYDKPFEDLNSIPKFDRNVVDEYLDKHILPKNLLIKTLDVQGRVR